MVNRKCIVPGRGATTTLRYSAMDEWTRVNRNALIEGGCRAFRERPLRSLLDIIHAELDEATTESADPSQCDDAKEPDREATRGPVTDRE